MDRLGWAAGVSFRCFNLRLGVRVSRPEVMGDVLRRLPHFAAANDSDVVDAVFSLLAPPPRGNSHIKRFNLLFNGAARIARTEHFEQALDELELAVMRTVARFGKCALVHSGAVAAGGRAILLPGRAFAGKTSLTLALVAAGAELLSDEVAVIDADGLVHPYPRPVGLRNQRRQDIGRARIEELGGRAAAGPAPVGMVVRSIYRPSARWEPRPMGPSEILTTLMSHTTAIDDRPDALTGILANAVGDCDGWAGLRGEAAPVAADLLAKLARPMAVEAGRGS